ncbi:MAG: hypothetical protein K6E27_06005 [Eubacterium sp.]|nr:hypothetical protein [Eubacterium sp.]
MFKGGSIKPVVIALLAISAIMISFSFPYLVFAYENHMLNGYGIHYDADPVRINSASISFTEKLRNMTSTIDSSSYVYVSDDNTSDFEINLTIDGAYKYASEAYMDMFICDDMLEELGMDREKLKANLFDEANMYSAKYLLIRPGSKDMYLVWVVGLYSEFGDMELLVDDETGKVLSMYASLNSDSSLNTIYNDNYYDEEFGKTLAKYYDMNYITSEYSASKSWGINNGSSSFSIRSIKLMGADPDEEIVLPYIVQSYSDGSLVVYYNFFSFSALNLDVFDSNIHIGDYYIQDYNDVDATDDSNTAEDGSKDKDSGSSNNSKNNQNYDPNQPPPYGPEDGETEDLDENTDDTNNNNSKDDKVNKGTPTDADKKEN